MTDLKKPPPLPSRAFRSPPKLPSRESRSRGTSSSSSANQVLYLDPPPPATFEQPKPIEFQELPKTKTMQQKRQDVINEIVATERTFVDGLKYLEQAYMIPLRTLQLISIKDYNILFQNIVIIINVNALLLATCEQVLEGIGDIGQVFIKYGPMLKTYTDYVNNYDAIVKHVRHLRQENANFDQFMRSTEQKAKIEGRVSFQSYMITPVQRLPRYNLLLDELLKRTPTDHAEYTSIGNALNVTKEVSVHVNERLRDQENKRILIRLHQTINGIDANIPEFINASRRLLYKPPKFDINLIDDDDDNDQINMGEPVTVRILRRGKRRKDLTMHVFVFNDMIMFIRKNKYKFHHLFTEYPCLWVYQSAMIPNVFELVTLDRIYLIRYNDSTEPLLLTELTKALQRYKKGQHIFASSLLHKYDLLSNDQASMNALYPTRIIARDCSSCNLRANDKVYLEYSDESDNTCIVSLQNLIDTNHHGWLKRRRKSENGHVQSLVSYLISSNDLLNNESRQLLYRSNTMHNQPVYLLELQKRHSMRMNAIETSSHRVRSDMDTNANSTNARNRSISSPPAVPSIVNMTEILNRRNSLKSSASKPSIDTNLLHTKNPFTANAKTPPWLEEIENKFKGGRFANVVHLKRQSVSLTPDEMNDLNEISSDDQSSDDESSDDGE
jgi:hypothetical protein